jgi:hypothetical protein
MYQDITDAEPLPEGWTKLYVGVPPATGPIRVGNTVTVKLAGNIDLYIRVTSVDGATVRGILAAIGPRPRIKYGPWKVEEPVAVAEGLVWTVIRTV